MVFRSKKFLFPIFSVWMTVSLILFSGSSSKAEFVSSTEYELIELAKAEQYDEIIQKISKKSRLEEKEKEGMTVLHWAVMFDYPELTSYLIKRKPVGIESTNHYGRTALHIAALLGNIEIAEQLLDAHAKVDAVTDLGRTPLFMAVSNKKDDMALVLLQRGADPKKEDNKGISPMDLAVASGNTMLINALRHAIKTGN